MEQKTESCRLTGSVGMKCVKNAAVQFITFNFSWLTAAARGVLLTLFVIFWNCIFADCGYNFYDHCLRFYFYFTFGFNFFMSSPPLIPRSQRKIEKLLRGFNSLVNFNPFESLLPLQDPERTSVN